jgi:hypothetical protein
MRRPFIAWRTILLVPLLAATGFAQADKLVGRWEGAIQSPQGERPTTAIFKKEGDTFTGRMPGMRPGTEIQLKEIKVEGNKVTARGEVETPQAVITLNYSFILEGDMMKGQVAADFGGQSFAFDLTLKRVSLETEGAASAGQGRQQRPRNPDVPQPQQKQSIDYFVGQWGYKYVGRESPLGPAPRDCTATFTKRPDGKSVEGVTDCRHEGGAYKIASTIVFDEVTKMMTFTEKLDGGVTLNSRADWSSPISIRFSLDPVKVKGQSLQLRRTISIVSAHSFTVTEELSEDGGPFIRLGNAVVTRVDAK